MRKILIAGCLFAFTIAGCSPAIPAANAPVPPAAERTRLPTPGVQINQNPPPCGEADLIYHTRIRMMILVNCVTDPSKATLLTIWGWDGTHWKRLTQDGPPGRILGGAAYDDVRDVLVLYGGRAVELGKCSQETWEWDGEFWEQINALPPTACDHVKLVYDASIQRSVLFSGLDPSEKVVDETWAWNGASWKMLSEDGPASRGHFGLVYDRREKRTLLYGGYTGGVSDEFWMWKDNAWEQIHGPGPGALSHFGMTVDTDAGALYLFGGATSDSTFSSLTDKTWVLKDDLWQELHPGSSASARGGAALGYDPRRKRVVLYGGFDSSGNQLGDTWEWDGKNWSCMRNCPQPEIQ